MKSFFLSVIVATLVACHARAATDSTPLVAINSAECGYTNSMMTIVELERGPNTSKLKLSPIKGANAKRESAVGTSLFIMRAFYEVAKARKTEYFINLKEWNDTDGGRLYIGGFTNHKDANIHDEFGPEFTTTNEYGQARTFMSVSQCDMLWGNPKK